MTDRDSYLARVGRELRADRAPADEVKVTPIATVPAGRREIEVLVSRSTVHGATARLVLRAPKPLNPDARRLEQEAWLYLPDLDALLAALTEARARLVAAREEKRPPAHGRGIPRGRTAP
jgi:hypothetical protein